MTYLEALAPYLDDWGLVHNVPQDLVPDSRTVSQNGLTYTAEALLIAHERGEQYPMFREQATTGARACLAEAHGILYRHPLYHHEGNQISIDCVVGYAAIARLADAPELARDLLDSWADRNWKFFGFFRPNYYNPDETQYRTHYSYRAHFNFLGVKYPATIAALEYAAGRKPPLWRRTWFGLAIRYGSVKTHDDARLNMLHAACHPDPYWLSLSNARVVAAHGSKRVMYAAYFNSTDRHPFEVWAV